MARDPFPAGPKAASALPAPEQRTAAPIGRSRGYSRLNDAMGVYVAASAVLTAVPVGLNRPVLWLGWVALTAALTILYLLLSRRLDPSRGLLSARHPWLFGLAMLVPAYAIVQTIPGLGALASGPPVPEGLDPETLSLVPDASRMAALRFSGYILFACLAIEVASRADRAHRIALWIFWGIVAHALFGLIALNVLGDVTVWGARKEAFAGSATGTFISRNNFATFLGIGLVLGLALAWEKIDRPVARKARSAALFGVETLDRVLMALGLAVIAAALLSTQSRAGVAVGGLGAATCFLLMRWKAGAPVWRAALALMATGAAALVVAIPVYGQDLVTRFLFLERSVETRALGYDRVVELVAARPMTGWGFDAFRPAFELVHTAPFSLDRIWDRAHSTILSNWAELGLGIGSLPILVAVLAAWRLLDTLRRRERDYAIGAAGLSAMALTGAHSMTDFSLEMPSVTILLVALVGLGLAHRAPAVRRRR